MFVAFYDICFIKLKTEMKYSLKFHHCEIYMGQNGYIVLFMLKRIYMVREINMGVCPRLEFDHIMFINCLGYGFYIYGAFEC